MKIAIITVYQHLAYSTPIWNLSNILAKKDNYIDIYCNKIAYKINEKYLDSGRINIIENTRQFRCKEFTKFFFWTMAQMNNKHYDAIIGVDGKGLIASFFIDKILRRNWRLGYFHLEFLMNIRKGRYIVYRILEIIAHKYSNFTIGLDKFRTNLLLKRNRVISKNVLNIANLHYEEAKNSKNKIKNIDDQIVIINLGSFSNDTLIGAVLGNLYFQDDYIKYIFHGWPANKELEDLILKTVHQYPELFVFSQDFLSQSNYRKLLDKAHIGLAFYNPGSVNTRYIGAASGKLFEYWKAGIPVICHRNTGMEYLVEGERAGLCIESRELKLAIKKIISKYDQYSTNSFKAYRKYYDLNNSDNVYNKIDSIIRNRRF